MPDLESVGDAVTGGVIGAAVEPAGGSTGYTHETHCLNCGAELLGPYCSACGQHAHVHRTLSAFFHDLLHGVLHFEGKIWRTLPLLAWRPGELTRRYIDGQRARFVSPIALFLFAIFLMFAVASFSGSWTAAGDAQVKQGLEEELRTADAQVASLEAQASKNPADEDLQRKLKQARDDASLLRTVRQRGLLRGSAIRMSDDVPPWLAKPLKKAAENPDLLLYKVKTNAYKFSWALIPISVPFVWLLFPFSRRFRLYDHTVFVTYSLSFMSLLLVASLLAASAGLRTLGGLLFLVPPFHIYRQLKHGYRLSRFGALWRTVLLVLFATLALSLFVALLFAAGVF